MASTFTNLIENGRQGMVARMQDLDTVSHNMANIYTTGYKSNRLNFQEVMRKEQMNGVRSRSTQLFMTQGNIVISANPLDLAIHGRGFFGIKTSDGKTRYTRNGEFIMDKSRNIVTADGNKLDWDGTLPENTETVEVDPDGTVKAKVGNEWKIAGTIKLYSFSNPSALTEKGDTLYEENPASGAAKVGKPNVDGLGEVIGGAVERSNVDIASEIVHMIRLQRNFTLTTKTLQVSDTMTGQAITLRS